MKKIIACIIISIFSTLTLCLWECTNEDILNFESNCYNSCSGAYSSCIANNTISSVIQGDNNSTSNTCYRTFQSCKSSCDEKTVEYQDNDCHWSNTAECNTENCDWICQKYWEWDEEEYICIRNDYGDLWINIDKKCLLNGQCSMNIYETIGIRKSNPNPDVKTFAQDIILWATMFFGTVMTVLFIVSWLSYVMAWFNGKSPDKAQKMMVGSIVWLLFVTFSYTIIRLIQFFATWWS